MIHLDGYFIALKEIYSQGISEVSVSGLRVVAVYSEQATYFISIILHNNRLSVPTDENENFLVYVRNTFRRGRYSEHLCHPVDSRNKNHISNLLFYLASFQNSKFLPLDISIAWSNVMECVYALLKR